MFIERNGAKIELTPEELRFAHEEYESEGVKDDLARVFAQNYLGFEDSSDFDEFIEDFSSNEGVPSEDFGEAYEELCASFGEETVCWLVNNSDEFLTEAYKVYNDNLDANEDYNSQIEYAVKTVLCDKSFEFKLYKVQEALENGKVFPGDVGFDFKGMWISNPFLDETGRFGVDPLTHYGSVNVSRYIDLFNEKASDKYITDVLWRDVEGFDTENLKNFINETPAGIDLCPDYRVLVFVNCTNTADEKNVPCYYVVAREISSENDVVSLWTTDLSREGFAECVECVLVSLNAYNKSQMVMAEKDVDNISYDKEPIYETEVIKATTISFTTNEGPDATQFDTQDPAEVMELFVQLLEENNLELVSVDGVEECEIVEKVSRVASVDELLNNAKQTCEDVNKDIVVKNDIELGKE